MWGTLLHRFFAAIVLITLACGVLAQDSLIGHWTFDEDLARGVEGKFGRALHFPGENSIRLDKHTVANASCDILKALRLYFDIRTLKRKVMLQS